MEPIFLTLVGGVLFAQSWYVLGLYSEGRTMGVFVGGLGLTSLVAVMFTPLLLDGTGPGADQLTEVTVMKALILVWALYAVGVAAHGLWDLDDRAIGFYCAFLAIVSVASFLYYSGHLEGTYSNAVWLSLSGATLGLSVIASIIFFYLAVPFSVLRLVTGWFTMLGGATIGVLGLTMMSRALM